MYCVLALSYNILSAAVNMQLSSKRFIHCCEAAILSRDVPTSEKVKQRNNKHLVARLYSY